MKPAGADPKELRRLSAPAARAALLAAAAAAASCAVSAWSFSRHFEGGITHEFCNYAEIGRNLASGLGLRTGLVYPYSLAVLDGRGIPFDAESLAPVLDRFPLHAWLVAAAEAALGPRDAAPALVSILLLALCAAAAALAGCRLFSPLEGAIAGLWVALDPTFQRAFVLWGLPDFGFCLLTLAAVMALCNGRWLAAGGLAGAAYLARPNLVLWLPLFAYAAWRGDAPGVGPVPAARAHGPDVPTSSAAAPPGHGWLSRLDDWAARSGLRRAALLLAAAALASAPGWLYSLKWYGSLTPPTLEWNLAHHVVQDSYPLLSYRTFPAWDTVAGHFPALCRKFLHYLRLHLQDLPAMWQIHVLFPFMLLGAFSVLSRRPAGAAPGSEEGRPARERRVFAGLMLVMLAVQVVAFSFLRYERLGPYATGRYFLWFAPAAFLLAARGAVELGGRLGRPRLLAVVLGAANAGFFIWWLILPQGPPAYPGRLPAGRWPELAAAAEAVPPGGLVATNIPGQVVWYAKRRALLLPADPDDLQAIARSHRVDGLLLSRLPAGELVQFPAWAGLLRDPAALAAAGRGLGFELAGDFGTSVLLVPGPGSPGDRPGRPRGLPGPR